MAEGVKQRWNKLHAIVNNSGATWGARYNEVPEKEGWDRVMNLNVKVRPPCSAYIKSDHG